MANLEKINALIVWFFSSEFKWLCLVAGDIYLYCDSLGEVGELNDVRVAGDGLAGGLNKMCLKEVEWNFRKREVCWVKQWVPCKSWAGAP